MSRVDAASDRIRLAMIGAGAMANSVHYPSLASFDDVEIAAICDLDEERLKTTADKCRVEKRYSNYQTMIEETAPDAVCAIGPPHHMFDVWTWCLKQGLNLYIDKPMGITVHQAEMLAHLAEEHDCITQVSFQRRSAPIATKMLQEVRRKGQIIHGVCRFYKFLPSSWIDGIGHPMNDGTHAVDTLRRICGGNPSRVSSSCKNVDVPEMNFYSAMVEFDTGATGFVICNWHTGRRVFDVEMHSAGAYAQVEHESKAFLYVDGDYNGVEFDTKEVAGSEENHVYCGFQAKNREFIDCLKTGRQPESCFADAVKTMELVELILAQALCDRTVRRSNG